jgi:hypothetical protein
MEAAHVFPDKHMRRRPQFSAVRPSRQIVIMKVPLRGLLNPRYPTISILPTQRKQHPLLDQTDKAFRLALCLSSSSSSSFFCAHVLGIEEGSRVTPRGLERGGTTYGSTGFAGGAADGVRMVDRIESGLGSAGGSLEDEAEGGDGGFVEVEA